MDLPTYTNIWRIEKRLYKLYDVRLPMPLPISWIAVFAGITIPYIVLLVAIGLPFNHTLVWLYILPPGVLTWLTTRPVLEGKRLPELLQSQTRYLAEPRTWVRLAPLAEKDQMTVTARIWHSRRPPKRPKTGKRHAAHPPVEVPVRATARRMTAARPASQSRRAAPVRAAATAAPTAPPPLTFAPAVPARSAGVLPGPVAAAPVPSVPAPHAPAQAGAMPQSHVPVSPAPHGPALPPSAPPAAPERARGRAGSVPHLEVSHDGPGKHTARQAGPLVPPPAAPANTWPAAPARPLRPVPPAALPEPAAQPEPAALSESAAQPEPATTPDVLRAAAAVVAAASIAEPPAAELPVTEPPAKENTITENPVTEFRVTESPVTESSVTESPVAEPPVPEPPAAAAPAAPFPAVEEPAAPAKPAAKPVTQAQNRAVPSIERALSAPSREHAVSWHGRVKLVTGSGAAQGPGARDQEAQDRNRARLPLRAPKRILVLGCTGGAGQTVTTLMAGAMLASLREHPVAAVDLHDGTLARFRAPAGWLEEILAGKPPQQVKPVRADGLHPTPKPNPARLDVIASHDALRDGDEIKLAVQLNRHYPLTLLDPGPAGLTRLLKVTDQLVVVVPASVEAAGALADTRDWLDANGFAELAMQSVTVINGVSRRSLPDVEQAEQIARGRSRAIVRVPWDDMLPVAATGPATLRAQTRVAYTALAGVLVAGLIPSPVMKTQ